MQQAHLHRFLQSLHEMPKVQKNEGNLPFLAGARLDSAAFADETDDYNAAVQFTA